MNNPIRDSLAERQTPARLMRSDGRGLDGTHANAEHHAQVLLPFVKVLETFAPNLGFAEWVQGHNVHELRTFDDRRFTLRGYTRDGAYRGIRLSMRLSRSNEVLLMDAESFDGINDMVVVLRSIAHPMRGNRTPLLDKDSATPSKAA